LGFDVCATLVYFFGAENFGLDKKTIILNNCGGARAHSAKHYKSHRRTEIAPLYVVLCLFTVLSHEVRTIYIYRRGAGSETICKRERALVD
jgi:hypothetical protein